MIIPFLIHRPIAVSMTCIAILVLGVVAMNYIPVSLMPDADIPEISVQVSSKNTSARELEQSIVSPLRRQLQQVNHLADISSETYDENSLISLRFDYGANIDFAFIEVNEKIDRAMNHFPRDLQRPRVIKASASDLPVFYLNLSLKSPVADPSSGKMANNGLNMSTDSKFAELSSFASQVIRRRIEQLPEVAMADMSGLVYPQLLIEPDMAKLESLGMGLRRLEQEIKDNHINLGNLLIRDGQYQYNVRFNTQLSHKRDIENIYLKVEGRLLQLKDVARVTEQSRPLRGMVVADGHDALSFAIIKQSDARMADLKKSIDHLIGRFEEDYPNIQFDITRDQTQLLDFAITNLGQSLLYGATLAFLVMFFFLRDFRSPVLIGITIPASLVLSVLFLYLAGISINIISLSGLILGVGMMIDNAIIVIDNITQEKNRGLGLADACSKGAGDVFRPLLSAVLTTCAVFVPMIFIDGIAGSLFYDQAMAVAIGLFVSLGVSVLIIPVYYKLAYAGAKAGTGSSWLQRLNPLDYESAYEKAFRWVMRHQKSTWAFFGLSIALAVVLFQALPGSRLPEIPQSETVLRVDFNEKIHVSETRRRIQDAIKTIEDEDLNYTALIGEQQFIMDKNAPRGGAQAFVYLKAADPARLASLQQALRMYLHRNFPGALYEFEEAGNIFNMVFSDREPPMQARLRFTTDPGNERINLLQEALERLGKSLPGMSVGVLPIQEFTLLSADPGKMMLYNIQPDQLYDRLKSAFNEKEVLMLTGTQETFPVIMGDRAGTAGQTLRTLSVQNRDGRMYPVRDILSSSVHFDLRLIRAGAGGEYFPVDLQTGRREARAVMAKTRSALLADAFFDVEFTGSIISTEKLIWELVIIFCISLGLLYFILAAQFESVSLPLIILLEVPIAMAGAFLVLLLAGHGINLMSLIGLVVMTGIIINDSILKIDTINQLRRQGYSLLKALLVGGQRRLKPILMTSITTILALLPLLFTGGLGAELQKPLALAIIGGLGIGTLVSLYFIPLCYYYLMRRKNA
jgi:multidrug efflux pump subunit AcrB